MKIRDLSIGSVVVDKNTKYYGEPINWIVVGKNKVGTPNNAKNTVILISEKVLCYKYFDTAKPKSQNSDRKLMGSNVFTNSDLFKWLNADIENWAGNDEDTKNPHGFQSNYPNIDCFASNYSNEPGFLTNFSKDFLDNISTSPLNTPYRDDEGHDGFASYSVAKVSLPSIKEVGLKSLYCRNSSGDPIEYFATDSSHLAAYPTKAFVNKVSNIDIIGSRKCCDWWLRDPSIFGDSNVACIGTPSQNRPGVPASIVFKPANLAEVGVRPVIRVKDDINVLDKDYNDVYELNFKKTIDENIQLNLDKGIEGKSVKTLQSVAFSVSSNIEGKYNASVYIDNKAINTQVGLIRNKNIIVPINYNEFRNLQLGEHTIKVIISGDKKDGQSFSQEDSFVFNKILEVNIELGEINNDDTKKPATLSLSVSSNTDTPLNLSVAVNKDKIVELKNIELKKIYNYMIPNRVWYNLLKGEHKLQINVSLGDDGKIVASEEINFTKEDISCTINLKKPFEVDTMPTKSLLIPFIELQKESELVIEVCNNAFDTNPTWENCTKESLNSSVFNFKNKEKTSNKWGYSFRITLKRNTAIKDNVIKQIAGSYK